MTPYIAFLSPEARPTSDALTGARKLARLTVTAARQAGFDVRLAARFEPGPAPDDRRRALASRLAGRAVRRLHALDSQARPDAIVSLIVRGGAPDLIGPAIAAETGIPHVTLAAGHGAPPPDAVALPPFLEAGQYAAEIPAGMRVPLRAMIGGGLGLDANVPWIAVAAMMASDTDVTGYRLLAAALSEIMDRPWQLVVAGDGRRRQAVAEALFPLGPERIRLAGTMRGSDLAALYRAADLFAWPALDSKLAMACLEAQAAGLPVVAGADTGAAAFVRDEETGLLCPGDNPSAFARAVARLLDDGNAAQALGAAARINVAKHHDIAAAARVIGDALARAIAA